MARATYEADRLVLKLMDTKSGKVTALTDKWDRSVGSLAWAPDSKSLLVTAQDTLETPLFRVDLKGKVTRLNAWLSERGERLDDFDSWAWSDSMNDLPLLQAVSQLGEYFAGRRRAFELPLDLGAGTAFQQSVWRALLQIAPGHTSSYGAISQRIGRPKAVRI